MYTYNKRERERGREREREREVQILKYETHAYKTFKTVGVQLIMLKHPTKHKKLIPIKPIYRTKVYKKPQPYKLIMSDR